MPALREMLTIFTTPKPFRGHIDVIQRNALRSWTLLGGHAGAGGGQIEVIVFGDEEGAAVVCREMGLRHEPMVERTASGTKYVRSIFGRAQEIARHDVLAYVNCDIVLTDDFARAVARVANAFSAPRSGEKEFEIGNLNSENWKNQNINAQDTEERRAQREGKGGIPRFTRNDDAGKFLMVGRRWDANITAPIDFSADDWGERARRVALETNQQRGPDWIDYFVFPRGMYTEIPPLVIGRVGWDNWLVWNARAQGFPVVDATRAVVAIHQNHDYGYHPQGQQGVWQDAEAQRNYELAGGVRHIFTMDDATHRLTPEGIVANPGYRLAPARRAWRRGRAAVWHAILGATRPVRHALGLRKSS